MLNSVLTERSVYYCDFTSSKIQMVVHSGFVTLRLVDSDWI